MRRSIRAGVLIPLLVLAACEPGGGPPIGSLTMSVKSHVPDSLRGGMPLPDTVALQFTAMSDGKRFAFEIDAGAMAAAMLPGVSGLKARVIYAPSGDSGHIGVILPPELVPMLGGVPGYRVDFPLSMFDSVTKAMAGLPGMIPANILDSIKKATVTLPEYKSLGTRSTVGGVSCENWTVSTGTMTMEQCVIPTPAILLTYQDKLMNGPLFKQLMDLVPGIKAAQDKAFGGRKMTPIRMRMTQPSVTMELVSASAAAPAASMFEFPADLKVVPLPATLPKLPGGIGGQ